MEAETKRIRRGGATDESRWTHTFLGSGNFGKITSTKASRIGDMTLKLKF